MSEEHQAILHEFKAWMEHPARSLRPESIVGYMGKVRLLFKWFESTGKDWQAIGKVDLEEYLGWLLAEKKNAPATRRGKIDAAACFYRFAVDRGYRPDNPTDNVRRPKCEGPQGPGLTMGEVERLLNAPDTKTDRGRRDMAILTIFAATGGRRDALRALRVDNFKYDTVEYLAEDEDGYLIIRPRSRKPVLKKEQALMMTMSLKGGRSLTIPLVKEAEAILQAYLSLREKQSPFVFPAGHGGMMGKTNIRQIVNKYGKMTGVDVHPHRFRHFVITWMLDSGIDPVTVQRYVGHKDVTQTLKYKDISGRSLMRPAGRDNPLKQINLPMQVFIDKLKNAPKP